MNSRIEQILLKVAPMAGEDGEYLPSLHTPEDIEKFAKLIIQDCLAQLALIGLANFENDDMSWTAEHSIKTIKERFNLDKYENYY
jgi:hypothetical protein